MMMRSKRERIGWSILMHDSSQKPLASSLRVDFVFLVDATDDDQSQCKKWTKCNPTKSVDLSDERRRNKEE